jgi:hypothetical protein
LQKCQNREKVKKGVQKPEFEQILPAAMPYVISRDSEKYYPKFHSGFLDVFSDKLVSRFGGV